MQGDELEPAGAHRGPGSSVPRPIAARLSTVPVDDHDHSPRLCPTCTSRRHLEIRRATRGRLSAELVAERIRADRGNVWPAALEYGLSYRHACEIRAGWRGNGRRAEPIPYSAGSWTDGRRNGWDVQRLELLEGGLDDRRELVRSSIAGA